jgi:hypothetical protein
VSPKQLVAWSKSAKRIKQMRTRGLKGQPGKLRHVWREDQEGFPPVPASKVEQHLLTHLWNNFQQLNSKDKEVVLGAVEVFLNKFSPYRPFVTFELHRELKAYLKALRLVRLPDSLIYIVVLPVAGSSTKSGERLAEIAKKYDLPRQQVQVESRGVGRQNGTLGVKVGAERGGRFALSRSFRSFVYCSAILYEI